MMHRFFSHFIFHIKKFVQAAWFPALLAGLFAIQNYAFNRWLGIVPELYFVRRTIVTLALGTLLYGPAIIMNRKRRYAYLVIISLVISLIFVSQYIYYSYFGAFLQASALRYAGQTTALTGTIKAFLSPKLLFFAANFFLVIIASLLSLKYKWLQAALSKKQKLAAAFIMLTIIAGGYGFILVVEKRDWGDTSRLYKRLYDLSTLVGKVGVVNYYIEDLVKAAIDHTQITGADIELIKKFGAERPTTLSSGKNFGIATGRNVFILQIESLETAVIDEKINGQEITPNLHRLAKEGLYFPNYYAQIGPGNTADAEFSTLNSLYPLADRVAFIDYAHNYYKALPELLAQNGYQTAVFHGDVPTFWNRSNAYPALGYQKWFSRDAYTIPRRVGFADLGDDDFFRQSISKLKTLQQPFLATLITLTSHTPFELAGDLRGLTFPDNTSLTPIQQEYLQTVHYVDQALGTFIEQLKQNGLYDNSLIALYGDHGGFTNITHGLGKDDTTIPELWNSKAPLVLLAPGTNLKGTNTAPGSHIDLYPTLANLLGIRPPRTVLGQDMLATNHPVAIHRASNTGVIDAVLTDQTIYQANADGVFEHGRCSNATTKQPRDLNDCREAYNKQQSTVTVSDLIVRGNLLSTLENSVR